MPHLNHRTLELDSAAGQTVAEYALVLGVVALIVLAGLSQVATPIAGFFSAVAAAFGG